MRVVEITPERLPVVEMTPVLVVEMTPVLVVEMTPVLVVEMTPVLVVEMTPVLVVEMTPVLVVEMTPVFANVVVADRAVSNNTAQIAGLRFLIVLLLVIRNQG